MSERSEYWPGESAESGAERQEKKSQETFSFVAESQRLSQEIRAQGQSERTTLAAKKWGQAQFAYNQNDHERARALLAEADDLLSERKAA